MLHNFRAPASDDHRRALIGAALAFRARGSGGPLVVSTDSREVSVSFAHVLLRHLNGHRPGELRHLGRATTPVAAHYGRRTRADGIHVTASHSPEDHLGLKLLRGGRPISVPEEDRLRDVARLAPVPDPPAADPSFDRVPFEESWGPYSDDVRRRLGPEPPGVEVEVRETWAEEFAAAFPRLPLVLRRGTDVARLGSPPSAADESARVIRLDEDADQAVIWDAGHRWSGQQILLAWLTPAEHSYVSSYDISLEARSELSRSGLRPVFTPVGDQYVATVLADRSCRLGGEPNGHLIDADWLHVPDGLYGGLRLSDGRPWATRPLDVPGRRLAVRMSDDEKHRVDAYAAAHEDYAFAHGMWEWRRGSSRCLVRFSAFEPTVVLQVEGIPLSEAPVPGWMLSLESDELDHWPHTERIPP